MVDRRWSHLGKTQRLISINSQLSTKTYFELKLFRHLRRMRTMLLKHARGRKFTELMTDHVLGNENGNKRLSVMHQKRVADKIRRHHRAPRPGFDWFLYARAVHLVDLLQKIQLDEGSFLQRSSHNFQVNCGGSSSARPASQSSALQDSRFFLRFSPFQNKAIARFMFATRLKSFGQLSPRTNRMMPSAAAF